MHKRYKPLKISFFSHGSKQGNSIITRLRVDRSFLNAHAFSIGLALSPECACGAKQETTLHILKFCPLYHSLRQKLFDLVGRQISVFHKLNNKEQMYVLLYGYKNENTDYYYINTAVTFAVQDFLIKTKRFRL